MVSEFDLSTLKSQDEVDDKRGSVSGTCILFDCRTNQFLSRVKPGQQSKLPIGR